MYTNNGSSFLDELFRKSNFETIQQKVYEFNNECKELNICRKLIRNKKLPSKG